jgi:hypothetical protein
MPVEDLEILRILCIKVGVRILAQYYYSDELRLCSLTYADVCFRMLTYAAIHTHTQYYYI